jgi:hypothetical protein
MNKTEDDIFALDILKKYEAEACGALSITYMLSEPSSTFVGLTGRINEEIIHATMPRPFSTLRRPISWIPGKTPSILPRRSYRRQPSEDRGSGFEFRGMAFTRVRYGFYTYAFTLTDESAGAILARPSRQYDIRGDLFVINTVSSKTAANFYH